MLRTYALHTEAKRCTGRNPGATRILLIARSVACSFLVEANHARDMVQDLGRNRLAIQNACHDRIRHGCLELVRVVTNVELPRATLVEPMDELAQLAAGKPALLPSLERFSDRQKSAAQLFLMRRGRALTEKAFHSLCDVCHDSISLQRNARYQPRPKAVGCMPMFGAAGKSTSYSMTVRSRWRYSRRSTRRHPNRL